MVKDNDRQITFKIKADLWKKFSIKCIEADMSKTNVLTDAIKKFLK